MKVAPVKAMQYLATAQRRLLARHGLREGLETFAPWPTKHAFPLIWRGSSGDLP
jgi:hypothetical protein